MPIGLRFVAAVCMLSGALALSGGAQVPRRASYPMIDSAVAITDHDTVQLLNRMLVDQAGVTPRARRLDVQYATRIAPSDTAARHAQADRAATVFGQAALGIGASRLLLALCDTRACAETREVPRLWYEYEYTSGAWRRIRL